MDLVGIIILFFIALLVGALFTYGFKTRTPWGAFWVFLLLLFLAALAGRYWITPVGPQLYGVAWDPVLFFVFIIALIIAASAPIDDRVATKDPADKKLRESEVRGTVAALGIFFWALLLFFLTAVIVGMVQYWYSREKKINSEVALDCLARSLSIRNITRPQELPGFFRF